MLCYEFSLFLSVGSLIQLPIGHHAVYKWANILHQDVSPNNIMFYRSEEEGVVGVMCDWDLAVHHASPISMDTIVNDLIRSYIGPSELSLYGFETVPAGTQSIQPSNDSPSSNADVPLQQVPRYRTGTGPFMALDILTYLNTPQHLYRHDLESFFWVFLGFVCSFLPAEKRLGSVVDWLHGDLHSIGDAKIATLMQPSRLNQIKNHASDEYKDYFDRPMGLLMKIIRKVKVAHDLLLIEEYDEWLAAKKAGDEEQLKEILEVIQEKVAAREQILTYETFLKCFGETP